MINNTQHPSGSDDTSHPAAEDKEARQRESDIARVEDGLPSTVTKGQGALKQDMLAFFMLGMGVGNPHKFMNRIYLILQ